MASRISHNAARSWRSFSRLICTRATGMIKPERMIRIVVATTSSINVKPGCFLRTYIFTGNELGGETCMKSVVGYWLLALGPSGYESHETANNEQPITHNPLRSTEL